jgi:heme-degrading monooxygenase HmoA
VPLAQLNIGRVRFPIDSPEMASFVEQLADVNAAAEAADGFIWRLRDDGPGSTSFRMFGDDRTMVNMSVWRDLESLRAFVIGQAQHRTALQDRHRWFERASEPMTVCWYVQEGHEPTLQEAESMLVRLREEGEQDGLFPFRYRG